jgi:hypothetical protein
MDYRGTREIIAKASRSCSKGGAGRRSIFWARGLIPEEVVGYTEAVQLVVIITHHSEQAQIPLFLLSEENTDPSDEFFIGRVEGSSSEEDNEEDIEEEEDDKEEINEMDIYDAAYTVSINEIPSH